MEELYQKVWTLLICQWINKKGYTHIIHNVNIIEFSDYTWDLESQYDENFGIVPPDHKLWDETKPEKKISWYYTNLSANGEPIENNLTEILDEFLDEHFEMFATNYE